MQKKIEGNIKMAVSYNIERKWSWGICIMHPPQNIEKLVNYDGIVYDMGYQRRDGSHAIDSATGFIPISVSFAIMH